MIPRRKFIRTGATALLAPVALRLAHAAEDKSNPFASFDREMEQFMTARNVPGGALAVTRNRKLVYARGYGWADREKKISAKPDSLFRIASISKPFTGVATLQLVEMGKLKLTDRAFDYIDLPAIIPEGKKADPRLKEITIGHLLHHNGGWNRDQSFDPMFRSKIICQAAGVSGPASQAAIIRYMLGQPLDFDPGKRYAYSNFGYCVLGRIIEKVTGMSYANFVQTSVLGPIGVKRMRLGATLSERQARDEVRYYTVNDEKGESLFPSAPGMVPWPYGAFHLEAMDAHGGWLASAVDLVRFTTALSDAEHSPLLKSTTIKTMLSPPEPPAERNKEGKLHDYFYGCGWQVRPQGPPGKVNFWHGGSLPGTWTLLVHRWDGLSWAVLLNQRSGRGGPSDGELDPAMHRAAAGVKEWPEVDLFGKYS
jgi:N-acyl-D-amino-acid deacylase